jgi:hypothetical protein
MNILAKGNIFSQIRQYFSKGNPQAETVDPSEEKEKAKLEGEESCIRFGKESEGTPPPIQTTCRRSTASSLSENRR